MLQFETQQAQDNRHKDTELSEPILQTKTSNSCRSAAKIGEDIVKAPARIAEENMLKFETQHAQDNRHRDTVSSLDTRQGHNCSLQVKDVNNVAIERFVKPCVVTFRGY